MITKNYAIIKGNGEISEEKIKYKANLVSQSAENDELLQKNILDLKRYNQLLVRSNEKFGSGELSFKLKFESKNTGVLLVLKAQDGNSVLCGPTLTEHKFMIANEDLTGNWKASTIAGALANYSENKEVNIKIKVEGSSITLFVNEVILCQANFSIRLSPIEFRMCSDKDFEIYGVQTITKKPKLFVIMQFSKDYNELYTDVIQPIATELELECVRADEFYSGTPILKDIVDSIKQAAVIIAEITPDNPNVFYEIGYSHAVEKPTILLCDKRREKLPFDLSGFRTLFYDNTIAGKVIVEKNLRKYLQSIIG